MFVYSDVGDGAGMTERWRDAETPFDSDLYMVLRIFSGCRSVTERPDSWHFYGPTLRHVELLRDSTSISPRFWLAAQSARLGRSPDLFRQDVQSMNNSGAAWQMLTTWNEWGEGTSIEPAVGFGTTCIDILAANQPPGGVSRLTGGTPGPRRSRHAGEGESNGVDPP